MITADSFAPPPQWALMERFLIEIMNDAALRFVERYTRPDGTLGWRDAWPGMDGSDDAYESFFNFPLLYALGGNDHLHRLARQEWDAITRQFTAYGQVYKEFDAYYDWMHHGESSIAFYLFGLADPTVQEDVARTLRFAGMYMDEDPEAKNYDPDRKLIRSPITGSKGPRFENSAEDWVTHRPILADYPVPFEDIPGVTTKIADWNDDVVFEKILKLLNERMMRGDVPLNLTATSLITHAYIYTGEEKYRQWVLDYVEAWMDRTRENGGIIPDNVGLSGKIGECMDGKWWGGYYGWRWPHGFTQLIEPLTIAAQNAMLLTGDAGYLDLPRSQLDRIMERGGVKDGQFVAPNFHGDRGWYGERVLDPMCALHIWSMSMAPEDAERLARFQGHERWNTVADLRGKGDYSHAAPWFRYIQGNHPDYPGQIMAVQYAEICRRLETMRNDHGDSAQWDVHHWQEINPVVTEALVQLTMGAPQFLYHGGLLHTRLRFFDPRKRRPGLPQDVGALVPRVDEGGVALELVNLSPKESREVTVQAGAFGEHEFTELRWCKTSGCRGKVQNPECETETGSDRVLQVHGKTFQIDLKPGSGIQLDVGMKRFVHRPGYAFPWH
ncbi:MAG: hypothetical protein V1800_09030 [Candidatus Latescibacterota bacterium]